MVVRRTGRADFCLIIGVVCSDVGGYAAGVLFGKHPMVPAISPKKSWEGFAGSLVCGVVGSVAHGRAPAGRPRGGRCGRSASCWSSPPPRRPDRVAGQARLGIKDMGTLLPGHGGIMDRLDSMLPSAFVTWLVFTALL